MKSILFFSCLLFATFITASGQINENFSDGDITQNPAWQGNLADFTVNTSLQLQSANTVANSSFYISTPNTKATAAQWDLYVNLAFNTSSANYVDIYVTASAADITLPATSGYFIRLGGTDDEISLFRKDASGASVKIIDGINGTLNTSNNSLRLRLICTAASQWNLQRDLTGVGNTFTSEGVVTDATYNTSAYFGIFIKQSTASFFQKHFFDDILVQDYVPDITAPQIVSLNATSATQLDVLFNEAVDPVSAGQPAHYVIDNGMGMPATATRSLTNPALVQLQYGSNFPERQLLTLTVNNVQDLAGNAITTATSIFTYFTARQFDIVIDEIMADPTPLVGMPDAEWIELRNRSGFDMNLQGWRVGKVTGMSGPMPNYILQKDSFVIVTSSGSLAAMQAFGPALSVTSFPSVNNTSDQIYLTSNDGRTIHSVSYTDSWYQNDLKKQGGWSLEMIDPNNPCTGIQNWKASIDDRGATPGKKNSVDAVNIDNTAPRLLRAYATDSIHITLVFSESLDSSFAALGQYQVSDGIGAPAAVMPLGPQFDRVTLLLGNTQALAHNKIYTVTATAVTDCSGNSIGSRNTARVGLHEPVDSFDVIVNEILFNPYPSGTDYVEIYNRSKKIISLKNMYLANRNTSGAVSSIQQISTEDYLLFPGDFMVLTASKDLVLQGYVAENPDAFIELSMPSYNDDKSNVILLNQQGNIVDELAYSDKWHFALISNKEGVALERVDYNAATQQASNWHSAASSVNYGTPTYKNSQYRPGASPIGEITVTPGIISPDNDGIDDFAVIQYQFPEPGYTANITIFDAAGRPVRYLQRNALNGIKGSYRWDGLGDKQQKLAVGLYIIYTQVFTLQGKTQTFKNVIVLAGRK